jgi:tripartite-type tricarboxylate transporter receptor subunit TctC
LQRIRRSISSRFIRRITPANRPGSRMSGGFTVTKIVGLAVFAALIGTSGAFAQDYPNRVITIISPFPPGGPSDTSARLVIGPMSKALGQQIIVENVTGAGGTIGSNRVAKARPDGYTLGVSGSGTHAAAEFLNKDLPYKSTDFDQIGVINISPVVLVSRSETPATTLKEFVAYLKANDKKVTEADAGVGSVSNLACSVFHAVADVHPTVASYRGTPQATMDLVAGTVDFGCNQIINVAQHIKTGKLKAYAVTGDVRSPMLPDVPTTAEAGMPQFNLKVWFGLSAPKDTPKPIIDKLSKALDVALADPEVEKRFNELGYDVPPPKERGAAYFDKFYKDEVVLWAKVLGGLNTEKK